MIRLPRIILTIALLALPTGAFAQGLQVAFGGLKQDPTLPIEMSADQLSIDQTDGTATFQGNVIIGQGQMRLSAPNVRVEYKTANGSSTGEISRLLATGGVTLVSGAEAAEAQSADYSIANGQIVMVGSVLLTQGANALSSERMVVNLTTGQAVMEGRVKTVIKTSDN